MKNAVFVPPYTSAGDFVRFINSVRVRRPNPLTLKSLQDIGINKSNAYTLFGTLKGLGLYDEKGTLLQVDELSGLASKDDDIRRESFKKIVDRTYQDLMSKVPIEETTVEKARYYFVVNSAAPSIAIKAARLFIWLANQAGYETAESEFVPYNLDQDKPQKTSQIKQIQRKKTDASKTNKKIADEVPPAYITVPVDYEEQLLRILLEKIGSTNEMPSADILKQVRELIEIQKQKNKHLQPDTNSESETQKETIEAE